MYANTHQHAVNQFLLAIGKSLPVIPQEPSQVDLETQLRLLLSEFQELLAAAGYELVPSIRTGEISLAKVGTPFDLVKVVDGCADVSVVNVGLLSLCGVEAGSVLEEVDQNNLAKTAPHAGGYLERPGGKFIKPKNHPAPDLPAVLLRQGWRPPDPEICKT